MSNVLEMYLPKTLFFLVLSHRIVFITSNEGSLEQCVFSDELISCKNLINPDISNNISAVIKASEIRSLTIKDSILKNIQQNNFSKYEQLERLTILNSQLIYIENGAFSNMEFLRSLNLCDNYLTSFSSSIFSPNSRVEILDLSNNLINDLNLFNVSSLDNLKFLNLSNNNLQYLPETILQKLKTVNDFYIVTDNNPWNCSHKSWYDFLATNLTLTLCDGARNYKIKKKLSDVIEMDERSEENAVSNQYFACIGKCGFTNCILWFFGGVWIGIIFGNMCKIKSLLFTKNAEKFNQCTQYDINDFHYRRVNINPITTIN